MFFKLIFGKPDLICRISGNEGQLHQKTKVLNCSL